MKKEVRNYLSIGFLVLAVLILAYFLNLGMTGFAVFEQQEFSPENNAIFSTNTIDFSVGVSDPDTIGIQNVSLLINGSIVQTNDSGVVGVYSFTETFLEDGNYNWNVVVYDSANVSSESDIWVFSIDTIDTTPELPENQSIVYGIDWEGVSFDINSFDVNESSEQYNWSVDDTRFIINGTGFLNINTEVTLAVDNYYILVSVKDSEEKVDSAIYNLNVTQATLSLDLIGTSPITPGTAADVGGIGCPSQLTCNFYRDGVEVSNPDNEELGEGTYNYVYNTTGNQNYIDTSESFVLTVEEIIEETEEIVLEPEPEPVITTPETSLSASEISPLSLNPGSSQKATVVVTNTGTKSLISCVVRPMGEFDSWILVSEEATNINIGKQHEFSFDVTVPEETGEGPYSLKVSIGCSEIFTARVFTVNVEKKKLEFEVISADRTRLNRVRIIYSLEELAGEDQDVIFIFSLVDANNVEVGRAEVNQSIDANSTDEFRTNININESLLPINETTNETLESELTLNVNFNSQIYSSSIQEKVLIGAPIGGFAIFEGVGAGEAVIFVVVLFVLVFIFIFARRMRRKGKTLKDVFKGRGSEST